VLLCGSGVRFKLVNVECTYIAQIRIGCFVLQKRRDLYFVIVQDPPYFVLLCGNGVCFKLVNVDCTCMAQVAFGCFVLQKPRMEISNICDKLTFVVVM